MKTIKQKYCEMCATELEPKMINYPIEINRGDMYELSDRTYKRVKGSHYLNIIMTHGTNFGYFCPKCSFACMGNTWDVE